MTKILKPYAPRDPLPGFRSSLPTRTQQHFKDECDINNIIRRFQITGQLGDPNRARALAYLDLSNISSLQDAHEHLEGLQSILEKLPAKTRALFDNNVFKMADFVLNPENLEASISLGFIEKPLAQLPLDVTVPADTAQSGSALTEKVVGKKDEK